MTRQRLREQRRRVGRLTGAHQEARGVLARPRVLEQERRASRERGRLDRRFRVAADEAPATQRHRLHGRDRRGESGALRHGVGHLLGDVAVPEDEGQSREVRRQPPVVEAVLPGGLEPPAPQQQVVGPARVALRLEDPGDGGRDDTGVVPQVVTLQGADERSREVAGRRDVSRGGRDDGAQGEGLRGEQCVVLVAGGIAGGDEPRAGIVPVADGEGGVRVGQEGVGEPPAGAELGVEGTAVRSAGVLDEVAVEEPEAEEEVRLEREGLHGRVLRGEQGRTASVSERLDVPALAPERDEERRQRPHGQPVDAHLLGDVERPRGRGRAGLGVTGEGQGPALLREHRHLLVRQERVPVGQAGVDDADELGGAVLQRERAEEGEPQRRVHLGGVGSLEERLRAGGGLGDAAGPHQGVHHLGRHDVGSGVPLGQQRLGTMEQVDGDERRPPTGVARRLTQPAHGPLVPALGTEHQVVGDGAPVGPGVDEGDRRLPVQPPPRGPGDVQVDGVVHQLVAEDDPPVALVEQLRVEGATELRHHLHRREVRHGRDVAQRHGVTEHRRHLEQLQRGGRQVAQASHDELGEGGRQLPRRRLDALAVPPEVTRVGEGPHDGDDPERVAIGLVEQGREHGARVGPQDAPGDGTDVVGGQRVERDGARAGPGEVLEQTRHLGRHRRGSVGHDDEQRRQGQPSHHR
ncbi:hypothetical protein [Intrasporangium flavum]|uniref:hypothetical protein n=1 Tax=Intrasporangium flavum TaxID=1428657 RepID=UPI001A958293|nr:hypothetical protein [Intrasporangium flavum]